MNGFGNGFFSRIIVIIGFGLLFLSCSLFEDTTIILWTNHPEIAAYIEVFNAEQTEYNIEIAYKASPAQSLLNHTEHPDLIIGEGLASRTVIEHLKPLDYLMEEQLIDKQMFYQDLFNIGYREQIPYLLPISFTVPVLVFKPDNISRQLDDFFISFRDIKTMGGEFNRTDETEFTRLGFSPEWDAQFLYLTTCLLGSDFRETYSGELAWNDQKLQESIAFIQQWITTVNQSRDMVAEFTDKYMYDPAYKLINNDRILFSYIQSINEFQQISSEKRESLSFRLIAKENSIRVKDDMLFLGVPKKSNNKTVTNEFITWFFNPTTQEKLMELTEYKRIRTFGIGDGFSSIVEVNERYYPRFYPFLSGHIPQERYLTFPSPLPPDWPEIKSQVLLPWLLERVQDQTDDTFSDRLRLWLMQRPSA